MTLPSADSGPHAGNTSRLFRGEILRKRRSATARPIAFCHFTIAHSALKSRSFHRQCVPLANAGFDVTYVSPAPIEGRHDNIEFVRLTRRNCALGRAFAQGGLLRILLRQKADIYHMQDPQLLPLALLLNLLFRKQVIYDAYEDFPSMAAHHTSLPRWARPIVAKIIALVESCAVRSLDAVLTADPLTLRRFARTGRSHKLVFYNFPNLSLFPAPPDTKKSFDVVYRGGLSQRAGTFLLLKALRQLMSEGRHLRLLLIGYSDGAAAEKTLRDTVTALGLETAVEIRGRIPHEEMAAALGEARIGVSALEDIPKFRLNIPVKIFEYWACGLPVIASDLPPSHPFMSRSQAGVVFPAGDSSALAYAIANLLDHPEEANRMGECGRAIVERRLHNAPEIHKLISLCRKLAMDTAHAHARGLQHA